MIVKEIIDDIKKRLNDTQEFYKRNWLLYLVDLAVRDIARQSYYWRKEVKLKLDSRYNCLNLPVDFLRLVNIRFLDDENNHSEIEPMDKDGEKKRMPILNQQTYQNNNWLSWISTVMPDADVWGLIKNGNVSGNLIVDEYLNIDLEVGQYLYFKKALSITAQKGWTVEGNIILPNEVSGGLDTEGLTNNIFNITDNKGSVNIALWTLPSYNKIWLEIDTENGTEEIECLPNDEIQFKINGSLIEYNVFVTNKTIGKTYYFTSSRTPSSQTQMITFGGELTGSINPAYPINAHKGLKWESLYLTGVNGLDYSNNKISFFAIQSKILIFDCIVRKGWVLLDYIYIPSKIESETDIIDIDDSEIIVYYALTKIQKGDDLIVAKSEYINRLQDITQYPYQKPFENLWEAGGGY